MKSKWRCNITGNATVKILVALAIGIVFLLGTGLLMDVSYDNKDARLRADVTDQERKIESNFDKMSKVILNQAQITDKYAADFRKVVKDAITGRYGDKGSTAMFQWIKEHNPSLDASVYKKLMTTVEAQRQGFDREQRKLSLLAAAHQKLFTTAPAKWFTAGVPVEIMIVSSTKTKTIMKTGVDDDTDLFKND